MDFIISKGRELPRTLEEMESGVWFNMWEKRNFPYRELVVGDTLYWLDTSKKRLIWKTKVTSVERYPYNDKGNLYKLYKQSMTEEYYNKRPVQGYFLRYSVKVVEKLSIPQPDYKFNQLGWEKMDEANHNRWFNNQIPVDEICLDDMLAKHTVPLKEQLSNLNEQMQYVSPIRVKKLIEITLRKDTRFVRMLKEATHFKCQYCGHQIRTKNNDFYIEVAHIDPVAEGGKSVLGNLLVLCPNHHKEFDYGNREIDEQTITKLSGKLNGVDFNIEYDW